MIHFSKKQLQWLTAHWRWRFAVNNSLNFKTSEDLEHINAESYKLPLWCFFSFLLFEALKHQSTFFLRFHFFLLCSTYKNKYIPWKLLTFLTYLDKQTLYLWNSAWINVYHYLLNRNINRCEFFCANNKICSLVAIVPFNRFFWTLFHAIFF